MFDALLLMLKELDQDGIDARKFAPPSDIFAPIYPTTWKELEDRLWIRRTDTIGHPFYRFTGDGWRTALDLIWNANQQMLTARLSKLAAALKDKVKGRDREGYVFLDSLAAETELPKNWIFNAIEGRLLDHRFGKTGAYWDERSVRGTMIRVPIDFGMEPL